MKVITRQLTKEILLATSFVLLALVALFAFFEFIGQLDRLTDRYTVTQAFFVTCLSMPMIIYEVMPIAALLAAVFVMSQWAARSEFTILRVAGLSPIRLAGMLMVPGFILMTLTYSIGEFIAPQADAAAREYKAELLQRRMSARGYATGAWVREVHQDINGQQAVRYINVGRFNSDNIAFNWHVLDFDSDQYLSRVIKADSARYVENQGWLLRKSVSTSVPKLSDLTQIPVLDKVLVSNPPNMMLQSDIQPSIFTVMMLKPQDMAIRDLHQYISHLKNSKQESGRYQIAFWNKVFYPLAIVVMIALSMPFGYMNTRSGGVSIKIFGGLMLGLAFYTINNLFSYIGMLNTWPPLVSAFLPTLMMLILAVGAMWFVEKR